MYKAKGKDGECWREGYYWKTGDNQHYLILDLTLPIMEIIPETLCRYTEKTDIEHKRIWENDIIIYEDAIGIIRYGEYYSKYLGFYIEWLGKHRDYRQDILFWIPKIKVIGNSFDNPEVIENANNT